MVVVVVPFQVRTLKSGHQGDLRQAIYSLFLDQVFLNSIAFHQNTTNTHR